MSPQHQRCPSDTRLGIKPAAWVRKGAERLLLAALGAQNTPDSWVCRGALSAPTRVTAKPRQGPPAGAGATTDSSPPGEQTAAGEREPAGLGARGYSSSPDTRSSPPRDTGVSQARAKHPEVGHKLLSPVAAAHAAAEEAGVRLLLPPAPRRGPLGSYLEDTEQPHGFLEDIRLNKIFQLGQGFLQVIYCTDPKAGSQSLEEAEKTH